MIDTERSYDTTDKEHSMAGSGGIDVCAPMKSGCKLVIARANLSRGNLLIYVINTMTSQRRAIYQLQNRAPAVSVVKWSPPEINLRQRGSSGDLLVELQMAERTGCNHPPQLPRCTELFTHSPNAHAILRRRSCKETPFRVMSANQGLVDVEQVLTAREESGFYRAGFMLLHWTGADRSPS